MKMRFWRKPSHKPGRLQRPAMALEMLERRTVLAGSVTASVSSGILTITGDAQANNVVISSGPTAGEVVLRGALSGNSASSATELVGDVDGDGELSFSGVSGIVLDLGNGADRVLVTDLDLAGGITGDLGAGNDTVTIGSSAAATRGTRLNDGGRLTAGEVTIGGDVDLSGGAGADVLRLADANVTGNLAFVGGVGNDRITVDGGGATNIVDGNVVLDVGAGDNRVDLSNLTIAGNLTVEGTEATRGVDVVLRNVAVEGDLTLNLSDAADAVVISGSGRNGLTEVGGNVIVNAGGGADFIGISRLTATNVAIDAGAGSNRINLSGIDATGAIDVVAGGGNDQVSIRGTQSASLGLDTGAGNDRISLRDVDVAGLLELLAGAGNDRVELNAVEALTASLELAAGSDRVDLIDSVFDDLSTDLGAGVDELAFRRTSVAGAFDLVTSAGRDVVRDRGGNTIPGLSDVAEEEGRGRDKDKGKDNDRGRGHHDDDDESDDDDDKRHDD